MYPLLVILISIIIGVSLVAVSNFYEKINASWGQLVFAYQHPQLVQALQNRYASGSAELEKELTTTEKSANDKLIEAVAEEVSLN